MTGTAGFQTLKDIESIGQIDQFEVTEGLDGKKRRKPNRTAYIDDTPDGDRSEHCHAPNKTPTARLRVFRCGFGLGNSWRLCTGLEVNPTQRGPEWQYLTRAK